MLECMSSRCYPALWQSLLAIYGCIPQRVDRKGICVGSEEAEGSSQRAYMQLEAVVD